MPKTYQAKPIYRTTVELKEKQVDIIIPFHGNYDKLYCLLRQIWGGLKSNPYHIYLVDDFSPNIEFIRAFESAPWTTIVRTESQLGFGGAVNAGLTEALHSPAEYIAILHSDCNAEDVRWLWELLKSYMILQSQNVGLVTAGSDNPTHDNPQLIGVRNTIEQDIILDEGYVPLYCALCEKNLFRNIGFLKPYKFGYYEDEEFAYRMRKHNLKQGISEGVGWGIRVVATFNKFKDNKEVLNAIEANREQCIKDIKTLN